MESQGQYDYAILGEGMAAWVAALLLSRQGDRVLIIPEKAVDREFAGRILFGLEPGGILLRMLERWGLSKAVLKGQIRARMECLTPETSLWIQGPMKERGLGLPSYELDGAAYEKLLEVVSSLEQDAAWKSDFEKDFTARVKRTTEKNWHHLPLLADTAHNWKRIIRKVIGPRAHALRLPHETSAVGEGGGRLLRGLGHLLYREESWVKRAPKPLQIAADLFALRNAYFSDEIFGLLRDEFRKILIASGVDFLPDGVSPHFKRDSTGVWEALYDSGKKGEMSLVRSDHLIFTRHLGSESLTRFESAARKEIEENLESESYDRYELEVRFRKNPFPFNEPAELVSRSPSGGWVRLSVYQRPETTVRVGAWVPSAKMKGDSRIVTERRLLREIRESLPGLAIDSENTDVVTEVYSERRFKAGIGVRGSDARIWHAHHQSYPKMGEYGPIIAAIEIARLRARKKKRVLPL